MTLAGPVPPTETRSRLHSLTTNWENAFLNGPARWSTVCHQKGRQRRVTLIIQQASWKEGERFVWWSQWRGKQDRLIWEVCRSPLPSPTRLSECTWHDFLDGGMKLLNLSWMTRDYLFASIEEEVDGKKRRTRVVINHLMRLQSQKSRTEKTLPPGASYRRQTCASPTNFGCKHMSLALFFQEYAIAIILTCLASKSTNTICR